ncbi:MAG: hypothetical protein ABIP58_02470 [Dehalococcoidia bacterium]
MITDEVYESFGETSGGVHDLAPVLSAMREERREYVSSAEADLEVSGESPWAASTLWPYYVEPAKRLRWQPNQVADGIKNQPNADGRLGAGASSHCAHARGGDALREYLDWRPFRYYTNRFTPLGSGFLYPRGTETTEFIPLEGGATMIHYRYRLQDRGRLVRLRFGIMRPVIRRLFLRSGEVLRRVMQEDVAAPGVDESEIRGEEAR